MVCGLEPADCSNSMLRRGGFSLVPVVVVVRGGLRLDGGHNVTGGSGVVMHHLGLDIRQCGGSVPLRDRCHVHINRGALGSIHHAVGVDVHGRLGSKDLASWSGLVWDHGWRSRSLLL